jgi:type IV pilus assembly protein PilM
LYVTRLPDMPDEELAEAVRWEAADRLGLDRQSVEADCIRTGAVAEGGRNEVLIVATPTEVIERRLDAVMSAGLRPMAVDTHFGAVARLFSRHHRREADQSSIRAVIEVGDTSTTLMVLHGDRIALCRNLDIGGYHMDARVSEHLGLELDAAADLRSARLQSGMKTGLSGIDPSTDRAVHESLRPLLEELARDVLMCLRYYGVTFKGQRPSRLMLTGAEACEPGLAAASVFNCFATSMP